MRFLLDTNILAEAGKKTPNQKVWNWLLQHADAAIPSIALAEGYKGARLAAREKRLKLLAELDNLVREEGERILPFDAKAADAWGEYVTLPALMNHPRGLEDSMIAAIALANGLTVATRNTADFPEVDTVNPFED